MSGRMLGVGIMWLPGWWPAGATSVRADGCGRRGRYEVGGVVVDHRQLVEAQAGVAGEEAGGGRAVQEGERRVVPVRVEQADGAGAGAVGCAGPYMRELVEGAESAGQRQERVCQVQEALFPLGQVGHDLQNGEGGMDDAWGVEGAGNDAGDAASGSEGGVGQCTHEAGPAAAIDEVEPMLGQELADRCGIVNVPVVGRAGGSAEHRHGASFAAVTGVTSGGCGWA